MSPTMRLGLPPSSIPPPLQPVKPDAANLPRPPSLPCKPSARQLPYPAPLSTHSPRRARRSTLLRAHFSKHSTHVPRLAAFLRVSLPICAGYVALMQLLVLVALKNNLHRPRGVRVRDGPRPVPAQDAARHRNDSPVHRDGQHARRNARARRRPEVRPLAPFPHFHTYPILTLCCQARAARAHPLTIQFVARAPGDAEGLVLTVQQADNWMYDITYALGCARNVIQKVAEGPARTKLVELVWACANLVRLLLATTKSEG
jgi:hypothetical protein